MKTYTMRVYSSLTPILEGIIEGVSITFLGFYNSSFTTVNQKLKIHFNKT
jgi:hypothetical protein